MTGGTVRFVERRGASDLGDRGEMSPRANCLHVRVEARGHGAIPMFAAVGAGEGPTDLPSESW